MRGERRRAFLKHLIFAVAVAAALLPEVLLCGEPARAFSRREIRPFLIERISATVSRLRGLNFSEEVPIGLKSRQEFHNYLVETIKRELPDEEMEANRKVLIKFGLISESCDLKALLLQIYTQNLAGFYDADEKKLFLIAEKTPSRDWISSYEEELILAHELTHALQDQAHGILRLPIRVKDQDDLAMACQALLEGDAFALMLDYAMARSGKPSSEIQHLDEAYAFFVSMTTMNLPAGTPDFVKEDILFPYIRGLSFIRFALKRNGWQAVDTIYDDPPLSTEQILHPEKYFLTREDPVALQLPSFSALLGDNWVHLTTNTVGEFDIAVLLANFCRRSEAEEAARGWAGDRYVLFENSRDKRLLLVWYTTWDTAKDAEEFSSTYRKTIENKYRAEELISQTPEGCTWRTEQGFVRLASNGSDVVLIEGADKGLLVPLERLLKETTKSKFTLKTEGKDALVHPAEPTSAR